MKLHKIIFGSALILISGNIFAQADTNEATSDVTISIPEVALLDLESATGNTNVTLTALAPTEAGNAITGATDDSIWMNYSSVVSTSEPSRDVKAAITAGTLPSGVTLSVEAAEYSGTGGAGTHGTSASAIMLSSTEQNLITGIGSSYTGDGADNGHKLTYSLDIDTAQYGDLSFDSVGALTITYTLTDN